MLGAQRAPAGAGSPAGVWGTPGHPEAASRSGAIPQRRHSQVLGEQLPHQSRAPLMPIHFSGSKLISDAALLSAVATCDADFARGCCEDFIFRRQLKNTLRIKPIHWHTRWKLDRERLAACRRLATKLFGRKR